MKYVRYMNHEIVSYGILNQDTIHRITASPFEDFTETGETCPLTEAILLSPTLPSKILCVGLNYRDHIEEMNHNMPSEPVIFSKPPSALLNPQGTIVRPGQAKRVDYEGELAIVIGREAKGVTEEDAYEYILGFTCANDVTARDLQPKDGQWTIAKGFDTFCPVGPVITDEVDPEDLSITTRLNGKKVQNSNTGNLIFSPAFLVSYLSSVMTLLPGDLILTGTPSGVGPLSKGDLIEITIEGIGTLSSRVE